jgi:hypothetical protein
MKIDRSDKGTHGIRHFGVDPQDLMAFAEEYDNNGLKTSKYTAFYHGFQRGLQHAMDVEEDRKKMQAPEKEDDYLINEDLKKELERTKQALAALTVTPCLSGGVSITPSTIHEYAITERSQETHLEVSRSCYGSAENEYAAWQKYAANCEPDYNRYDWVWDWGPNGCGVMTKKGSAVYYTIEKVVDYKKEETPETNADFVDSLRLSVEEGIRKTPIFTELREKILELDERLNDLERLREHHGSTIFNHKDGILARLDKLEGRPQISPDLFIDAEKKLKEYEEAVEKAAKASKKLRAEGKLTIEELVEDGQYQEAIKAIQARRFNGEMT